MLKCPWQMPLNDWNVITKEQQHINPWYAWSSHPFFFLLHVFSRLLLPSSHGIHLPPFLVTAFCITNRISKEKKKRRDNINIIKCILQKICLLLSKINAYFLSYPKWKLYTCGTKCNSFIVFPYSEVASTYIYPYIERD